MDNRLRRVVVPVFRGDEKAFPFWKKRFEQHLKQEGLLYTLSKLPAEEDYANPVPGATAEQEEERQKMWEKRLRDDDSTINELWMALDDEPMGHVLQCQFAKEIMLKLNQIYKRQGAVAMLGLRSKLYNLKQGGYKSLRDLFARHQELVRELQELNDPVPHKDQVSTLLLSIPDKYQHIIGALSVVRRAELEEMSIEQIQRVFLDAEESARQNEPGPSQPVAMYSAPKVVANGHSNREERPRKPKKDIECYECGRNGHKRRNCRIFRNRKKQARNAVNSQSDNRRHDAARDVALVSRENGAFKVRIPLERINEDLLRDIRVQAMDITDMPVPIPTKFSVLLDSGATQHMLKDRQVFQQLWEAPEMRIGTAEQGNSIIAKRRGNALLRTNKNARVEIYDAIFIPELSSNLLSVSRIESTGKSVHFFDGKVEIRDKDGSVVITGKRINGLYHLDLFPLESSELTASALKGKVFDEGKLWHQRFGHLGFHNMSKMVKDNMGEKLTLQLSSIDVKSPIGCDACVFGKQSREPFDKTHKIRSTRPLELIHSDVCGHFPEPTHDGFRYFVTFMDDYTHFLVVYLMKHKSEVFLKFQEYEAMVTAQFSQRISKLRSDNGGEYYNKEFISFCKSKGIQMIPTTPYTPQQNGVSERVNRTLMDKVRSIMHESKVPMNMWGEVLYASAYTLNRSPTSALTVAKTPHEMWFGFKPDLSKLKVFGCVAYAHVNKEHTTKLDMRSRALVMVGYAPNGFRLWDETNRNIVISRDVKFDEFTFYFDKDEELKHNDLPSVEVYHEIPIEPEVNTSPNQVNTESESDEDEFVDIESSDEYEDASEATRRSQRMVKRPIWLRDYETSLLSSHHSQDIPQTIQELKERDDWHKWKHAVDEEVSALIENNTWTLVSELPQGRKAINSMWVFSIKDEGNSSRYKARLVAKGCSQRPGVDYSETFAPVAKMTTVRVMLSIAVKKDWLIHQMDVKTAFLNGSLQEEIYMRLPPNEHGQIELCKLNKSIYGLKQAGRSWNHKFDETITKLGFHKLNSDSCLYYCARRGLYIILYVDDILIFGKDMGQIKWIKEKLSESFKMKDLGEVSSFLGLDITRCLDNGTLELSQQAYIEKVLARFGMKDCKPVATPMDVNCKWKKSNIPTDEPFKELLGSLQYLTIMSRPDITIAVSILSQFQSSPGKEHWDGLKRILRYLQGTKSMKMVYTRDKDDVPLRGYSDADFANDLEERKSNSGCVFTIYGNTVSWGSKRQQIVSLSSTESELVALCHAAKEGVWMSNLLREIGINLVPYTMYEDSIPCIRIAEEAREHQRTKHIDVKYMYVRSLIKDKQMLLKYIPSENQLADLFTKPLPKGRFIKLLDTLGMIN